MKPVTNLDSLLVCPEGYRQGWPCLRGTGITVHNVAAAHMQGATLQEICEDNPDLDPSLFYAAMAYYFANRERIEAELHEDAAEGARLAAMYPDGTTGAIIAYC